MRKFLAPILCAVLFLTVCGCTTAADRSATMQEILSSLRESQYLLNRYELSLAEKSEEDESVSFCWNCRTTLWSVIPAEPSASDILIADAVGSMCEACGWTCEKKQLGDEENELSGLLDEAVRSGSVGAILLSEAPGDVEDELRTAAREGIIVLSSMENAGVPLAGSVVLSEDILAQQMIELVTEWSKYQAKYTGESMDLTVMAINGMGADTSAWNDAMMRAVNTSATLFVRSYADPARTDVFDEAYDWARDVMKESRETRVFCCRTPEAAYGVCCYLEQYCADKKYDLADYCVVWVGQDDASNTYLTAAAEDPSCTAAKGCILYGDTTWETAAKLGGELLGIAYGNVLPAEPESIWAMLSENGVEPPEEISAWEWGLNACLCTDTYASFGDYAATLLAHTNMPLADIYKICAN